MNRAKTGKLAVLLLLLCCSPLWGADISVSMEPEVLRVNETGSLDIRVDDADSVELMSVPGVKNLDIEYAGTARKFEFVNGRTWSGMVIQMRVRASAEGSYTIPPIKIRVDGEVQKTRPVTFKVRKTVDAPSGGESMAFGMIVPARNRVRAGEPVLVRYYLLHSGIDLRNMGSFRKMPVANGAVLEETEESIDDEPIRLKGSNFTKTHLATMILTPVKEGEITIEGGTFVVEVMKPFGFMRVPRHMKVRFESVTVNSLPLPEKGQPADFKGDVGHFSITMDDASKKVRLFEEARFTVTVKGSGSIHTLSPPVFLNQPDEVKVITSQGAGSAAPAQNTIEGSREFTYTLIPSAPGTYRCGPARLSYFDTGKNRYITKSTGSIVLEVTGKTLPADDSEEKGTDTGEDTTAGLTGIILAVGGGIAVIGLVLGVLMYLDRKKLQVIDEDIPRDVSPPPRLQKTDSDTHKDEIELRQLQNMMRRSLRRENTGQFLSLAEKMTAISGQPGMAALKEEIYRFRYGGEHPTMEQCHDLYNRIHEILRKG